MTSGLITVMGSLMSMRRNARIRSLPRIRFAHQVGCTRHRFRTSTECVDTCVLAQPGTGRLSGGGGRAFRRAPVQPRSPSGKEGPHGGGVSAVFRGGGAGSEQSELLVAKSGGAVARGARGQAGPAPTRL